VDGQRPPVAYPGPVLRAAPRKAELPAEGKPRNYPKGRGKRPISDKHVKESLAAAPTGTEGRGARPCKEKKKLAPFLTSVKGRG